MEKEIKIEEFENKTIISFLNFSKEEEDNIKKLLLIFLDLGRLILLRSLSHARNNIFNKFSFRLFSFLF